jgi:hypothetical protein
VGHHTGHKSKAQTIVCFQVSRTRSWMAICENQEIDFIAVQASFLENI